MSAFSVPGINKSWVQPEETRLQLDVPYEPSPHEVVREMIRLANVTSRDVVYDLGCGDGRIVIAAAQATGARGVGIDLDPVRIHEAVNNARKASVADRVHFVQQDLFESNIKQATVVMLFLYPDVNLRLRSKLLSELNPGSRVVSHFHDMGEWEADKSVRIGRHPVYFWIIPAHVAGKWTMRAFGRGQPKPAWLQLDQKFQKVRGEIILSGIRSPIMNGRLAGNRLSFQFFQGRQFTFEGKADGPLLKGTIRDNLGNTVRYRATRTDWEDRDPNS